METNHTTKNNLAAMALPITMEVAFRLMHEYQTHDNRFTIFSKKTQSIETLKGFSIDRAEIEQILSNSNATRVYIGLGHHYGQDHPTRDGVQALNHLTVVAFGLDSDDHALVSTNHVFDYCDPCPDRCPKYSEKVEKFRKDLNLK